MRASTTMRRRLFAGPVRLYRLTRRVLRYLQAPRVLLLLFSLLVTLNLTLICQGHDTSGGHVGPHVTMLFRAFHVHSASPAESNHSVHMHAHSSQTAPKQAHPVTRTALYSAGANTVGASQTAELDAFGFSSLGWVSLLLCAPVVGRRGRLIHFTAEVLKSQITPSPDAPPPRLSF